MKTGWERNKPFILPDVQRAAEILEPFLKGRQILHIEALDGGLSNSNLKLSLGAGELVVLRIYSGGGIKAQIEQAVLELVNTSVPVPQVLFHDFSLSQFEYPFLLLSWVDGIQLSDLFLIGDNHDLSEAGNEVGRYLAKMHAIGFDVPGFFDEQLRIRAFERTGSEGFVEVVKGILTDDAAIQNLGSAMVGTIRQFAENHAHILDKTAHQSSLVHSDFNPLNILVEKDGGRINVTGILDWEFAFSNSPLIDIGNMLRYENVRDSAFMGPFLRSYRQHGGTLPPNWLHQAKLLDMVALCDLANKEDCGEVRLADVKKLLRNTMDEWDLYSVIQENIK